MHGRSDYWPVFVREVEGETSLREQFECLFEIIPTPFLHLMEITSGLFFIILSLK